jgi:high-affinity nickel permease
MAAAAALDTGFCHLIGQFELLLLIQKKLAGKFEFWRET